MELVRAAALKGYFEVASALKLDPVPLIEGWLLPRYDALVTTTAAQKTAWTSFCAAPATAGLPALKTAYGATSDAWNAVEFITFGPVSLALRADRFAFFPDKRNAVARSLDVLPLVVAGQFEEAMRRLHTAGNRE